MALTIAPVRVRKGSGLRSPRLAAAAFDPYPIDDATPMTSSQEQYDALTYSRSALRALMEAWGEPYILKADFGLYYEAIDPTLGQRAWIRSQVLDTAWGLLHTGELRLWNPARREWFPTDADKDARFDQVEQERDQAQREAARLEAEIRRLQARMAGLDPDADAQ